MRDTNNFETRSLRCATLIIFRWTTNLTAELNISVWNEVSRENNKIWTFENVVSKEQCPHKMANAFAMLLLYFLALVCSNQNRNIRNHWTEICKLYGGSPDLWLWRKSSETSYCFHRYDITNVVFILFCCFCSENDIYFLKFVFQYAGWYLFRWYIVWKTWIIYSFSMSFFSTKKSSWFCYHSLTSATTLQVMDLHGCTIDNSSMKNDYFFKENLSSWIIWHVSLIYIHH